MMDDDQRNAMANGDVNVGRVGQIQRDMNEVSSVSDMTLINRSAGFSMSEGRTYQSAGQDSDDFNLEDEDTEEGKSMSPEISDNDLNYYSVAVTIF